jgi:hypothetical protein
LDGLDDSDDSDDSDDLDDRDDLDEVLFTDSCPGELEGVIGGDLELVLFIITINR